MNILVISNNKTITNATYIRNPEELDNYLKRFPIYDTLLFVCWSWIVPVKILQSYKCYGMHTGFLLEPGHRARGGDPIGNLQKLRVGWAALNGFEMDEGIDTGKVKLAIPICVAEPKEHILKTIDSYLTKIELYLRESPSAIPDYFKRSDAR